MRVARPPAALSYVLLHELLHLREPGHTDRFRALLTRHLPAWRAVRRELGPGTFRCRFLGGKIRRTRVITLFST